MKVHYKSLIHVDHNRLNVSRMNWERRFKSFKRLFVLFLPKWSLTCVTSFSLFFWGPGHKLGFQYLICDSWHITSEYSRDVQSYICRLGCYLCFIIVIVFHRGDPRTWFRCLWGLPVFSFAQSVVTWRVKITGHISLPLISSIHHWRLFLAMVHNKR